MIKIYVLFMFFIILKKSVDSATFKGNAIFSPEDLNEIDVSDKLECEAVTKLKSNSSKNNFEFYTAGKERIYISATSKSCFSFKIRGVRVDLAMSSVPKDTSEPNGPLEVVLDPSRVRVHFGSGKFFVDKTEPKVVLSNIMFTGFWMHYTKSGFLEMGNEGEIVPFFSYQHNTSIFVNFFGIASWNSSGAWIIDSEPKCPGNEVKQETEMLGIKCFKKTKFCSNSSDSLENFIALQKKIISAINKMIQKFCVTKPTNVYEIADFYSDLTGLFKESKKIHKNAILLDTDGGNFAVITQLLNNEETIYDEIRKKVYETFAKRVEHTNSSSIYANHL